MKEQDIQGLLKPRYKVIADYPGNIFKVGHIVSEAEAEEKFDFPHNLFPVYPNIFKPLAWYEHRTLEQLQAVKYVKVTNYVGYWRVGDIVEARFGLWKDEIYGYFLKNHFHPMPYIEPVTEQEYKQFDLMKKDAH